MTARNGFYTLCLRVADNLDNEGGVNAAFRPAPLDSIGSALDLDGDNQLEIIVSSGDG